MNRNALSRKISHAATLALLFAAAALLPLTCGAQQKEFSKWPAGKHTNFNRPTPPAHITYPETVAWYGALTLAKLSGDSDLTARLIHRFDPLFAEESSLVPNPVNVDSTIFGAVPLEIYIQTKQQKYLDMGQGLADKQWEDPTPEGF